MSKPKYKQGVLIRTIGEFENCDSLWFKVKFGNSIKTMHYSFLCSWQYWTLLNFIKRGAVYTAVPIDKEA